MDEPYYLFASNSSFEALSVIGSLEIAVVAVDQSMQEMDVLDFLKNLGVKSPYTMVIIMTGYSGIKETCDTIYSDSICRFVKKPLDNNEIKQAVKSAITEYEINCPDLHLN